MKKLIIIVITLFFLNNCGYSPIYSSKNSNFYIKEISIKNKNNLSSKIKDDIKRFSNQNNEKIINLEISSDKKINIKLKDKKGDPSMFNMIITLTIKVLNKNNYEINKIVSFTENFEYNNNSNKFSLKQYEKEIEANLINKIVEKSILYLSEI